MQQSSSYGVVNRTAGAGPVADAIESIRVRGYCVVENVLTDREVSDYNDRIDAVYARQCAEVGGVDALRGIGDEDIVRCPLAYDAAFVDLATKPAFLSIVKELLGTQVVLLMQNAIINRPDRVQAQTKWHRDLNYQHWVCSKPLALGALVCLEDFTPETGGTVFLPGSHRFEPFPSDELVRTMSDAPTARKGSAIVFDAMTFHRAGTNTSTRIRRAVNHVIGVPILGQPVDIPAMLAHRAPTDEWLAGYLGFRWNPVASVREWRLRKIATARRAA